MSTFANYQITEVLGLRPMPHRHTAMLCAIIVAFAVRALIGDFGLATILFFLAVVVLMIFFLYSIQSGELVGEERALRFEHRRRRAIEWTLRWRQSVFALL